MKTLILDKVLEYDIISKMDELLISINKHMMIIRYSRIENDDQVIYGFLCNGHYERIIRHLNDN